MFTLTIPVVDFMSGAPIVGAEISLHIRFAAYAVSVPPVQGTPYKLPSRFFLWREMTIDKLISPADGVCRVAVDLRAAYDAADLPANVQPINPLPLVVTATLRIPWLEFTRTVAFSDRDIEREWVMDQDPDVYSIDGVFAKAIRIEYAAAIVGHVTTTSATLWFNLHGSVLPGYSYVCDVTKGGTLLQSYPVNFHRPHEVSAANIGVVLVEHLPASSAFEFNLRLQTGVDATSGLVLAQGSFKTAPADSEPMRLMFGSCHTPTSPRSLNRWDELARRRDADLMLLIGDQIYGDVPEEVAEKMKHQSTAAWRDFYTDLYHAYWTRRSVREVMRRTPTYMILDDHDVVDDYGIVSLPPNQVEGALDVYRIFQQAHNPGLIDGPIHYSFRWGSAAFFMMDDRTKRVPPEFPALKGPLPPGFPDNYPLTEDVVMGIEQLDDFRKWAFSPEAQSADVIFFVAPVPIAFLPVEEVQRLIRQLQEQAADVGAHGGGILGAFGGAALGFALGGPGGAVVGGFAGYAAGAYGGEKLADSKARAKIAEEGFANLTDNDLADM